MGTASFLGCSLVLLPIPPACSACLSMQPGVRNNEKSIMKRRVLVMERSLDTVARGYENVECHARIRPSLGSQRSKRCRTSRRGRLGGFSLSGDSREEILIGASPYQTIASMTRPRFKAWRTFMVKIRWIASRLVILVYWPLAWCLAPTVRAWLGSSPCIEYVYCSIL